MKVIPIPLLRDNYAYLVVCEETKEAGIVDPSESAPVLRKVEEEGVHPKAILNTHHHRDHTGGNEGILARWPVPVYAHRIDARRIPSATHLLEEGGEVQIGKLRGRVLFIPGHTNGQVAFHFEKALFTGDTLFVAGCGRLSEGTPQEMQRTLSRLRDLPADTLVYCGHEYTEKNLSFALALEPNNRKVSEKLEQVRTLRAKGTFTVPSTMAEERETNPFLRWESQEIQQNLKKQFPDLPRDPVAVFGKVRELKDAY